MIIGIDGSRSETKERTGVEWYSHHIISELQKHISEEYIVKLYRRKRENLNLPKNWRQKVLRIPFGKGWTSVRLSLEMILHHPDILFVPSHALPPVTPKNVVTMIHDIAFTRFPKLYDSEHLKNLKTALDRAIKKANIILTPSYFTKTELLQYNPNIPEKKIQVVHHGINHSVYRPIEDKKLMEQKIISFGINKPYFVYIGRIESKKNIVSLLAAFEQLIVKENKDVRLVLAGKLGFGYNNIKKEIEKMQSKSRVIQIGWISEQDKPILLSSARALVFPSWYEGFGIPGIEAMACGTPVIASNTCALPEVLENSALLISPGDNAELVEAMSEVLENDNLCDVLRAKGIEQSKKYSWESAGKETWEIFKSLL